MLVVVSIYFRREFYSVLENLEQFHDEKRKLANSATLYQYRLKDWVVRQASKTAK